MKFVRLWLHWRQTALLRRLPIGAMRSIQPEEAGSHAGLSAARLQRPAAGSCDRRQHREDLYIRATGLERSHAPREIVPERPDHAKICMRHRVDTLEV
ncbi:hypothetical protein [Martelella limonii]|uniref:hypothetical protein n=1 Tax=Martelella limonii TaxID=1647649 RepID=UPI0015800D9E|nr:hypothetical protein [Martelella limonii]